jgi:hypothetical protein
MIPLAAILIFLHGPDGREIDVNPDKITSLQARMGKNKNIHDSVECIVNLSDGKFVSVVETCETISRKLQEK